MHPHLLTGEALPLVPLAGDAILGIATLGTVLVFLVCLGLREGWDHTIGYGLRWIANKAEGVVIDLGWFGTYHVLGPIADAFRWIDHGISHALAVAALNTEKASAWLWHLTGRVFWWSVHETKHLALDAWHMFEHTYTVTIPDAAKWARREATAVAHRLVAKEEAARHAADAELGHLAHVAEHDAKVGIAQAEAALDWSEAQVGALGDYIKGLEGKVAQLARRLSPAALVGLIGATIFNDLGLGWLRCRNVNRMGRALCGIPEQLLKDALELIAGAVLFQSLCEVMPLVTEAVDVVGLELVHAVHVAGLGACSSKFPPPPPMPKARLSLPTTTSSSLSLATG